MILSKIKNWIPHLFKNPGYAPEPVYDVKQRFLDLSRSPVDFGSIGGNLGHLDRYR